MGSGDDRIMQAQPTEIMTRPKVAKEYRRNPLAIGGMFAEIDASIAQLIAG